MKDTSQNPKKSERKPEPGSPLDSRTGRTPLQAKQARLLRLADYAALIGQPLASLNLSDADRQSLLGLSNSSYLAVKSTIERGLARDLGEALALIEAEIG